MLLAALAWRNLWRRPQRTVLSLLSIILVSALLVFLISFTVGVYATMKETTLRIFDGYAQLQPAGYADDPTIDRAIPGPAALALRAEAVDGVGAAAPRVNAFAILANGARSYGAAVVGVDPAAEARISSIAATIRSGRFLAPGDTDAAVLGDLLARNLGLSVGGRVTLLGAGREGASAADILTVVGIYHSGLAELDRSILEMPLARAQDTFSMTGAVNTIALAGPSLAGVNHAIPALRDLGRASKVSVLDWAQLEPALDQAITLKWATAMLLYFTLVAVTAFITLNTLLMSVLERVREFGVLLALGMRPGQVGAMVWMELLALAGLGCAIGLIIGAVVTLWLAHTGIVMPGAADAYAQFGLPSRLRPTLTPFSALIGPGAILAFVVLGGIVPYLRVAAITPAQAVRVG